MTQTKLRVGQFEEKSILKATGFASTETGLLFDDLETTASDSSWFGFGYMYRWGSPLRAMLSCFLTGSQLVTNTDFEGGTFTGWTSTGSPVVSTNANGSGFSAKVNSTNYITQTITVVTGEYYLLRFMCSPDVSSSHVGNVVFTGGDITTYLVPNITSGYWTRNAMLVLATSTSLVLSFRSNGSNYAYFDDIWLKKTTVHSGIGLSEDTGDIHIITDPDSATTIYGGPDLADMLNHASLNNIGTLTHAQLDSITTTGWIQRTETWTRTGNHTFTISGDHTLALRKGTKIRYKDGGSYEYGVVGSSSYGSPNTTVNLIPNTDYAMAAVTITDTYLSYVATPEGFPSAFNYLPTYAGSGVAGPPTMTTTSAKWSPIGQSSLFLGFDVQITALNGATGTLLISIPVTGVGSSMGAGRENQATGSMIQMMCPATNGITLFTYNNGAFITVNWQLIGSIVVPY